MRSLKRRMKIKTEKSRNEGRRRRSEKCNTVRTKVQRKRDIKEE